MTYMEAQLQPGLPHMTWDEIKAAWPDEYVVLDELVRDPVKNWVCGGRVLAHAPSRKEALTQARPHGGRSRALRWTGKIRLPPGWTGLLFVE
jgi:hypothetical protein